MVGQITKHLKKGERIRIVGLGILQVRKRAARMGRNPATGEADPDQGQQEGRLPRRQGTQGSRRDPTRLLISPKRHSGSRPPEWRFSVIEPAYPCSYSLRSPCWLRRSPSTHTVTERFLRYVVIDTQSGSDLDRPALPPRSRRIWAACCVVRIAGDGRSRDAHLDEHGYVYATIPANTDKQVSVICFCSHMDTSPDCTGKRTSGRRS